MQVGSALLDTAMVGVEYGKAKSTAVYRSVIHHCDQLATGRSANPRLGGETVQTKSAFRILRIHRQKIFCQSLSPDFRDPLLKVLASR